MVLPECGVDNARMPGDRLKKNIELYNSNNPALPLSIAIGVACRENSLKTMERLFKEADENMYRDKFFTRDQSRDIIDKFFTQLH